jgi:hypothetical protein
MAGSRCTVTEREVSGWRALCLASDALSVTVLPGKGADIYQIIDLATGIDPLFKAPWGLQPPGAPPRAGSDGTAFLENYEGTWQELFPTTGDPGTHDGRPLPFHGEVATRPWSWTILPAASLSDPAADAGAVPSAPPAPSSLTPSVTSASRSPADAAGPADDSIAVRFSIDCDMLPLRLERTMRLTAGQRSLVLDERVTNLSDGLVRFTWGHHCVLGAPLLADGADLRVPATSLSTPAPPWEDTARLVPGQQSNWPVARRRDGGLVDLSVVPGPEAGSHDDVYLTGLTAGWAELRNPRLRTGFRLDWDPEVFRWVISWQAYGGAVAMPLAGAYALGLEPWTTGGNLEAAAASGEGIELPGGGSLETTVTASFLSC